MHFMNPTHNFAATTRPTEEPGLDRRSPSAAIDGAVVKAGCATLSRNDIKTPGELTRTAWYPHLLAGRFFVTR